MNLIRSLLFYLVFYAGTLVLLVLVPFQGRHGMRRVAGAWSGVHRWALRHILRIRVICEGAPIDRPALYAMRHESFFEAIDSAKLFDAPVVFAKQELLEIPVWGGAATKYGIIPVARADGAKALRDLMRAAKEAKAEGRPFLIFPEGTRTPPKCKLGKLQRGAANIAIETQADLIPVVVHCNHDTLKKGVPWYRIPPSKIQFRLEVDPPILFNDIHDPGLPRAKQSRALTRFIKEYILSRLKHDFAGNRT